MGPSPLQFSAREADNYLVDGFGTPFGPTALRESEAPAPDPTGRMGTYSKVYVIWLAGASCDGCTVGLTGATQPRMERLMVGDIPGVPRVVLLHTDFALESGAEYLENLFLAERGELDAPYLLTYEGSVQDEASAGEGFWCGLGADPVSGRQLTSREWLERLAPNAAAVVAIGTCAAFGGVPSARGNATGATSVPAVLGHDLGPSSGVPVVTIPGCAPPGDNYVETISAILLHLNGLAPLPEFDDLGRPAWLYRDTVHAHCSRVDTYLEGVFAKEYGEEACLINLGCAGPTAVCNMADRGMIDGHGGCMKLGGICIGCTMPGFPDAVLPATRPGARRSLVAVRPGTFRRRLASKLDLPLRHERSRPRRYLARPHEQNLVSRAQTYPA